MANDKKFVVKNGLQSQNISFVDSGKTNTITANMLSSDTLSFEGQHGQLFSIADSMNGTIFSVNDVSGIPSIEVDDDGEIRFAETFGHVLIGTDSSTDTAKHIVQITGGLNADSAIIDGMLSADSVNINSRGIVFEQPGSFGTTLTSDPTAARTLTLPDETGTIATREQLAGDSVNGAGVVSDEIITRGIVSAGTNTAANQAPFSASDTSPNFLAAGNPHGGFITVGTMVSRRAFALPVTVPGTDANTTTNIDGFVFRTGFSGTINEQTFHIGLYTMNKFGYPSQLVSRGSGSTGTANNVTVTLTPSVTAIKPGRYYAVAGVFNDSNTNSFAAAINFASTSAGGSFYCDAGFQNPGSTQPKGLTFDDALVDTSTVADVLPADFGSIVPTSFSASMPLIHLRLGTQYTGE